MDSDPASGTFLIEGHGAGLGTAPSRHTPAERRSRLLVLALALAMLASAYPLLARWGHEGTSDAHATLEMVGSLMGLMAGFALVIRFYTLGRRFDLLVGLAFFVNGAEDLVHGLLSFEGVRAWSEQPASLERPVPRGKPQRSQSGDGTARSDARHRPQTLGSEAPVRIHSPHETHPPGSRRWKRSAAQEAALTRSGSSRALRA